MDVHEVLLPEVQLVGIFDWSMGHACYPSDALAAHKLKSGYVSKHPHCCRDTTIPSPPPTDSSVPSASTDDAVAAPTTVASVDADVAASTTVASVDADVTAPPTVASVDADVAAPPTVSSVDADVTAPPTAVASVDADVVTPTTVASVDPDLPEWCHPGARVRVYIPKAGLCMWTTDVLEVVSTRRRGIMVTVKKPHKLDERFKDFRCNGKQENEIVVPLIRNNRLMFKEAESSIAVPAESSVISNTETITAVPAESSADIGTDTTPEINAVPRKFPSLVEFPFNSGQYVDYVKPVGSIQRGKFVASDPPPYYTITAKMPNGAPPNDKVIMLNGVETTIPGYVGKCKDAGTYLLERGELDLSVKTVHRLTRDNVTRYRECQCQTSLIKPCCRSKERVFMLSQQSDFLAQRSSLEELFFARGHLILFGVKCHPEIAGLGVEYLWGKCVCVHACMNLTPTHCVPIGHSKRLFRNKYNDTCGKKIELNVRKSMATPAYNTCANPLFATGSLKNRDGDVMSAPMTQTLVCRFARRTRIFERIYKLFPTPEAMEQSAKGSGCTGFELMEKLYKICSVSAKAHRNTFDQEVGLFRKIDQQDQSAFAEDSVHENGAFIGSCVTVSDHSVDDRVQKCFDITA